MTERAEQASTRENEVKPRQRERVCVRVNEWKKEAQRLNGIEN
jgi:hypothetical protein